MIIHGASGEVRGLTTAATMWAMTGIGVAVGLGHELLGALLALLVYVIIASGEWPAVGRIRRRPSRSAAETASERLGADLPVEANPTNATSRQGPESVAP